MFGLTPVRHNAIERANACGDFYNAIDNFFNDDFFGRSAVASGFRMDVREDDKSYIIEAELPGVKREEISLDYNKDTLYITVDQKSENSSQAGEEDKEAASNESKVRYLHRERRMTSMRRGIYLENINKEAIEAKLDSGVLTIIVPKLEEEKTQFKITVQ